MYLNVAVLVPPLTEEYDTLLLKLDNIYNGEYTYNQKKVTRKMLQEHFCYIEQFPFFIEDLDITSHFLMINECIVF